MQLRTNSLLWRFLVLTYSYDESNKDQWPTGALALVVQTMKALLMWAFMGYLTSVALMVFVVTPTIMAIRMYRSEIPVEMVSHFWPPIALVVLVSSTVVLIKWLQKRQTQVVERPPGKIVLMWRALMGKINSKVDYVDVDSKK